MDKWKELQSKIPYTCKALVRMCKMVGVLPINVQWADNQWYMAYSWTLKDEKKFQKWLIRFWKRSPGARDEILARSCRGRKEHEEAARWFTFMYGWKIKDLI